MFVLGIGVNRSDAHFTNKHIGITFFSNGFLVCLRAPFYFDLSVKHCKTVWPLFVMLHNGQTYWSFQNLFKVEFGTSTRVCFSEKLLDTVFGQFLNKSGFQNGPPPWASGCGDSIGGAGQGVPK
jgi:hypothetical protein